MKINIDLVKTGTVVTDVASVFVLVATSNINVYALNVSLHSGRVSINVNIRKNHSMNKCRRDVVVKRNSHLEQDWMIWTLKPLRRSKVLVKFGTIIPNVFHPHQDRTPYFFKNFPGDWICTFDPGGQGSFHLMG